MITVFRRSTEPGPAELGVPAEPGPEDPEAAREWADAAARQAGDRWAAVNAAGMFADADPAWQARQRAKGGAG